MPLVDIHAYCNLWKSTSVNLQMSDEMATVVARALSNWNVYRDIRIATGVPEHFTACVDYREPMPAFNHRTWIANGDPLFDKHGSALKTKRVPKGLGPAKSWEDGVMISFEHQGLHKVQDWSLPSLLYQLEKYNGFGYHAHGIPSPYLWSMTNHYTRGKFDRDGHFDPTLVDKQIGCVPILIGFRGHGMDLNEKEPA